MHEPNMSDVYGKGHACKLRMDKKVADSSFGWVIHNWRTYGLWETDVIERQKEEKPWTELLTCVGQYFDLLRSLTLVLFGLFDETVAQV